MAKAKSVSPNSPSEGSPGASDSATIPSVSCHTSIADDASIDPASGSGDHRASMSHAFEPSDRPLKVYNRRRPLAFRRLAQLRRSRGPAAAAAATPRSAATPTESKNSGSHASDAILCGNRRRVSAFGSSLSSRARRYSCLSATPSTATAAQSEAKERATANLAAAGKQKKVGGKGGGKGGGKSDAEQGRRTAEYEKLRAYFQEVDDFELEEEEEEADEEGGRREPQGKWESVRDAGVESVLDAFQGWCWYVPPSGEGGGEGGDNEREDVEGEGGEGEGGKEREGRVKEAEVNEDWVAGFMAREAGLLGALPRVDERGEEGEELGRGAAVEEEAEVEEVEEEEEEDGGEDDEEGEEEAEKGEEEETDDFAAGEISFGANLQSGFRSPVVSDMAGAATPVASGGKPGGTPGSTVGGTPNGAPGQSGGGLRAAVRMVTPSDTELLAGSSAVSASREAQDRGGHTGVAAGDGCGRGGGGVRWGGADRARAGRDGGCDGESSVGQGGGRRVQGGESWSGGGGGRAEDGHMGLESDFIGGAFSEVSVGNVGAVEEQGGDCRVQGGGGWSAGGGRREKAGHVGLESDFIGGAFSEVSVGNVGADGRGRARDRNGASSNEASSKEASSNEVFSGDTDSEAAGVTQSHETEEVRHGLEPQGIHAPDYSPRDSKEAEPSSVTDDGYKGYNVGGSPEGNDSKWKERLSVENSGASDGSGSDYDDGETAETAVAEEEGMRGLSVENSNDGSDGSGVDSDDGETAEAAAAEEEEEVPVSQPKEQCVKHGKPPPHKQQQQRGRQSLGANEHSQRVLRSSTRRATLAAGGCGTQPLVAATDGAAAARGAIKVDCDGPAAADAAAAPSFAPAPDPDPAPAPASACSPPVPPPAAATVPAVLPDLPPNTEAHSRRSTGAATHSSLTLRRSTRTQPSSASKSTEEPNASSSFIPFSTSTHTLRSTARTRPVAASTLDSPDSSDGGARMGIAVRRSARTRSIPSRQGEAGERTGRRTMPSVCPEASQLAHSKATPADQAEPGSGEKVRRERWSDAGRRASESSVARGMRGEGEEEGSGSEAHGVEAGEEGASVSDQSGSVSDLGREDEAGGEGKAGEDGEVREEGGEEERFEEGSVEEASEVGGEASGGGEGEDGSRDGWVGHAAEATCETLEKEGRCETVEKAGSRAMGSKDNKVRTRPVRGGRTGGNGTLTGGIARARRGKDDGKLDTELTPEARPKSPEGQQKSPEGQHKSPEPQKKSPEAQQKSPEVHVALEEEVGGVVDNDALEEESCGYDPREEDVLAGEEEQGEEEGGKEAEEQEEGLRALLAACRQPHLCSMQQVLSQFCHLKTIQKIGEGSYAEAFAAEGREGGMGRGVEGGGGRVCLKIVPVGGRVLFNGEPQKTVGEMLAEVEVQMALQRLRHGNHDVPHSTTSFIDCKGVRVCKGVYAPLLVSAWEQWAEENESLNDHPRIFPSNQAYVVFILEMAGEDLEKAQVRSFDEARCILLQVTAGLAVAEAACEFEHRDLHWGNVLIHRTQASQAQGAAPAKAGRQGQRQRTTAGALNDCTGSVNSRGNSIANSRSNPNCSVDMRACKGGNDGGEGEGKQWLRVNGAERCFRDMGLRVAIIDFSLSRLKSGARVHFSDLSQEPVIFQGAKGDPQFDTYREMKKKTRGRWDTWCPGTNSLWLKYLAEMLLTGKKVRFKATEKRAISVFKERMAKCPSAQTALDDELFQDFWSA